MAGKIKFVNEDRTNFHSTLKSRIDEYFESNQLSRYGNGWMVWKTLCLLSLFLVPYFIILFADLPLWSMWVLTLIMGFGKSGIGMGVMHDAMHGSYSSNKKMNSLVGRSINLIGGHAITWKIQHNVLHHTYTNIAGHDEDIETIGLMRFTPETSWKPVHRYQHLFSWFFYGLLTLFWAIHKDLLQLNRYNRMGLINGARGTYRGQLTELFLTKVLYYVFLLVIPMWMLDIHIGHWAIGFLSLEFVAGMVLGLVFQAAHVVLETDFPVPDSDMRIQDEWAIHQVKTTANFGTHNRFLTWYCGGLNYQIEHHLFPKTCHVHYPNMAKIVKQTAQEFSLPYHHNTSFSTALLSHFSLLKELGKPVDTVPAT